MFKTKKYYNQIYQKNIKQKLSKDYIENVDHIFLIACLVQVDQD